MQFEKAQNRRQLFTSVLRYTALGVLGAVGGFTYAKKRRLARNGICINREICASCGIFEECGLPPALSAKTTIEKNR
ncbi:MAG: hypothetical protein GY845_20840 [Planctomycetes bacterium]|nr:hypothetical protein [Planctomycetota bacterium]